jgi:glycosyltransferase involved in cell wall biosynthesis
MSKERLLFVYDYFYPAYKAGGPVQSLTNLAISLQDEFEISVLTGSNDLGMTTSLAGILPDQWNDVMLPGAKEKIKVWYASSKMGWTGMKDFFRSIQPSVVYLNGIFTFQFVLLPLLLIHNSRIVICPRGMLQPGALAGKSLKKKLYIFFLKLTGIISKVSWHATGEEEMRDIKRVFGKSCKVTEAGNIPKPPVEKFYTTEKKEGALRLVHLSVISEKKNLLFTIELISSLEGQISLDIYGPVKDKAYWEKCQAVIRNSKGRIQYKGDVMPLVVQEVFSKYDAAVFFTKGENFGHALYESLSAGRPIITSYFTPWNNLQMQQAGWNTDIADREQAGKLIRDIAAMDAVSFRPYCEGALALANKYFREGCGISGYIDMFSENKAYNDSSRN